MKSRFRIRYVLILILLFLVYQGWKAYAPVKGYKIKGLHSVSEEKISEVRQLIPEPFPKSVELVKSAIRKLNWVQGVKFKKGIRGIMSICIQPRVPVARITNKKGVGVDREGILFPVAIGIDTLPSITIKNGSLHDTLGDAVRLLKVLRGLNVNGIEITARGLESRIGKVKVIWGSDGYPEKYRLLKRILKTKVISSGILDMRFDNQVVLRR
jgi:cell division septal protein FtsQ